MKSQAEIIGEYVIWLEAHSDNNFHQSFANAIIRNAPEWFEEMKKEQENGSV